jgi:hypothetical protein
LFESFASEIKPRARDFKHERGGERGDEEE